MSRFVEVVFPIPLNETFTYDHADSEHVQIGHRVLAPFGPRSLTGYVVNLPAEAGDVKTKSIHAVLDEDPILTSELIALARTMAELYDVSLGQVISTILPPGLTRQTRRKIKVTDRVDPPLNPEATKLWERVRAGKGLDFLATVRRQPSNAKILRELEVGGWIRIETVLQKERTGGKTRVSKEVPMDAALQHAPAVQLNSEQVAVCEELKRAVTQNKFQSFLLHGVTGSGKTEVYLQTAAEVLRIGRNVLALVPEIALTPQFVGRFKSRFGDQVSVLHSGRSETARVSEWRRIGRGEARIVIGARSAVFSPIKNLGVVIVDEEHDASYKQEEGLLYNARDLARLRAESEGAAYILGSATPSLETYLAAGQGTIQLLELTERATGQDLPTVEIVDLRATHVASGTKGVFSPRLLEKMRETLGNQEQIVLFLNRRGFAPAMLCPTCGKSMRCEHCSVSLTLHHRDKLLLCHYCGRSKDQFTPCGVCGQTKLIPLGVGTEKVERELHFFFPDARIARMDRDSVRRRGEHERILTALAKKETDILIGTQMVTKGIDLPGVALVGVLLADQSLHIPDFRSAERTFQLLTQVVGRAGRGDRRGHAIVQTFQPDHYAVTAAARQDFKLFYNQELPFRKELNYPPFTTMNLIEISGPDRATTKRAAMWVAIQARKHGQKKELDFLGPSPAPVEKVDGNTRFHFIVRSPSKLTAGNFSRWLTTQARALLREHKVSIKLDLDPYRFV